jgi:alkylation response protein AidB-like acyl-CoA dehydrogenase
MTSHESSAGADLAFAEADLAVAAAAFSDLAQFLATGARPWFEAGGQAVRDEQTIQHRAGVIAADLRAAEALAASARSTRSAEVAAGARLLAGEVARAASRFLFEAGGTSTTDDERDFARHWRAAAQSAATRPLRDARRLLAFGRLGRPRLAPDPDAPVFVGAPKHEGELYHRADLVAAHLLHGAADRDRLRRFPFEGLGVVASSGLLATSIPGRFGGLGYGLSQALEICRRLGIGDSSICQILTIHFSMLEALQRTGTEAQLARWLPRVVAGGRLGNAAAERGVAHAKVTTTRLSVDPSGGRRLNGRKFYSTGALGAELVTILAVDEAGELTSIVLEAATPGLKLLDDWRGLGQRGTGSGTTILDEVAVGADDILPRWLNANAPGTGTAAANLAHVPIDLGIAAGAIADLSVQIDLRGLATEGEVLAEFGKLSARLDAVEALFEQARARLSVLAGTELSLEQAQGFSLDVSVVKVLAGELAIDISAALIEIAGNSARDPQLGLDRHWRNARTHTLHDPSRWRYLRIGEHALTGRLPPRNRSN